MPYDLTPEELAVYARTAQQRAAQQQATRLARRARALALAARAAALLKADFGATRVVLFGSLARSPRLFDERSDVDLAVWGLDEPAHWRAWGVLLDLDPEFSVDLVDMAHVRPALAASIAQEGQEL